MKLKKLASKLAPNPEYRTSKKGLFMMPETLGLPVGKRYKKDDRYVGDSVIARPSIGYKAKKIK